MKKVLFICFFMIFSLDLSAKAFDTMLDSNKEEIAQPFLKETDKNQKIKIIDSYINTKEDFKAFLWYLSSNYLSFQKSDTPDYSGSFIFLLEYYVNKFNNISIQKGSIDRDNINNIFYITTITKADDVEEFINLLKKNKELLNLEISIFSNKSHKFIPHLIDTNNFSEMEKLLTAVKEYRLYTDKVMESFDSHIRHLTGNIGRESFNKKRIDLSDFVESKEDIIFTTFKTLNKYGITINFDTNGDITRCNTVFKTPFLYETLPTNIQELVLDYCKVNKSNKSKVDEQIEWYKPGYNFKSLKGYLEFVAYSQYNWIFAALIILYIFLESRKIILTRLYNKEKNELILSSRDFFYENKIEKNEILPIKLIIDKYKLYNSLVENYDKLYIKSLKLGLYNTANKNKLTSLKNEITSLKKEIEILKEELINLEEKFQTKELQNLINIKTRIEKLKDSTTFGYILDSIIKVQNEINELLENYTDDKFSDSKIKEIESFIQKIEEQVNESSIYLEEYNRLVEVKNPYDVLGVDEKDEISVIKKKWKELCLKYHSDKNIDKPKYIKDIFEETIKIINNAWDIISKQNKKEI